MSRVLAIDYGQKRVGIAVTDTLQIIATGLKTLSPQETISFLKGYIEQEDVECIVVGEPHRMDYSASEVEADIQLFINDLQKSVPHIPVVRYDERFTSKIASQSILDMGLKKKDRQNKGLIDTVSATLILQSFLEHRNRL